MPWYFHSTPFFHQFAISVNQKSTAFDASYLLAIHVFHFHDVEHQAKRFIRIGNQFKRQVELGFEAFMRAQAVAADAEDCGVVAGKLRGQVTKMDAFRGTAGRVVFWIEVNDEILAAVIGQIEGFAAGHRGREVGHCQVGDG